MAELSFKILPSQNAAQTGVHRKPTATDCKIPHNYCHPTEHKISDVRYLINRMLDYLISNNKTEEEKVIQTILRHNLYHDNVINTLQQKIINNIKNV
jgi:hypothetical protein